MIFWSICLWDKGCGFPADFKNVSDLSFQEKAFKTFLSWPVTHFSNIFSTTVPAPHAYSITLIQQMLWRFYMETFNVQMDYRSKIFSYFLLWMLIIWYYVSNVEYRKTCPFCVMENGLFTCMPSNSVHLSDWEQDQKDIMLYLPILIAKIV